MEYTNQTPPRCVECVCCVVETDQGGLDQYYCDLNPAVPLAVQSYGRCKFHKPRISKP